MQAKSYSGYRTHKSGYRVLRDRINKGLRGCVVGFKSHQLHARNRLNTWFLVEQTYDFGYQGGYHWLPRKNHTKGEFESWQIYAFSYY